MNTRLPIVFLFLLLGGIASAQTTISGKVISPQGDVLPGANVYIKDSYDGATSDTAGVFKFKCLEEGTQTLVTSYIGYEQFEMPVELTGEAIEVEVKLKEEFNTQNTVLISAGGFGANDKVKAIVLNPLDIVTTAGAAGDVFNALQYLPGTQAVGEENGLFVRGGAGSETVTIIDELIVQRPFFSAVPDVPSRSRFNPFLFKGTFFSTGAYSARYGQALSSALVLNTTDLADTSRGGLNLLPIGGGGFFTKKWKKTSLSLAGNYIDVKPLFLINEQAPDWEIPPRAGDASIIFRHKPSKSSIIKLYSTLQLQRLVVKNPDPFDPQNIDRTKLASQNFYNNLSYRNLINENWVLYLGASASRDEDDINVNDVPIAGRDIRLQGKAWLSRGFGKNSKAWAGAETHRVVNFQSFDTLSQEINDQYTAAFAESEIYLSPSVAFRPGFRVEHSSLLGKMNVAPRASFAVKASKYGSVSLAFGHFYQNPIPDYTFYDNDLDFERADHYLANYTWIKKKRTFRVEGYYKDYQNLIRTTPDPMGPRGLAYDNSGYGYATGVDVFWRDQSTIRNGDYWISYSYLDTRRLFQDFPIEAQPYFASNHNASFVYKHFVADLRTSFGASYAYASGRPYFNPNLPEEEYLSERTPDFHLLSLNAAYLTSIQNNFTVVFVSLGNALGRNNVFGYRYSPDGSFRLPVNPPQRRNVFAGVFISFG